MNHGLVLSQIMELLSPMLLAQFIEFLQELRVRFDGLVKVLPGDELQVGFVKLGLVGDKIEKELHIKGLDEVVGLRCVGRVVIPYLPDPAVLGVGPVLGGDKGTIIIMLRNNNTIRRITDHLTPAIGLRDVLGMHVHHVKVRRTIAATTNARHVLGHF